MGEGGSSLFQRLIRKQVVEGAPDLQGAMGSGDGNHVFSDDYASDNSTLLSLQPWVFRKSAYEPAGQQKTMRRRDKYDCNAGDDEFEPPTSPSHCSTAYVSGRNHRGFTVDSGRTRSRRPHRHTVKTRDSLERNSFIPQLYGDGFEVEEFVFGPVASSSMHQCSRPFRVMDGNRVIGKWDYGSLLSPQNGASMEESTTNLKATDAWSKSLSRPVKFKRKSEELQPGELGASDSVCNDFTLQEQRDRLLLFCLGLGVGVISSMLANKKEVEQLNDLLKHKENLVQDLQEELDMKDTLTVNELVNDASDKHQLDHFSDKKDQLVCILNEASTFQSAEHDITTINQSTSHKEENSEYLSQIEAELEAELQRLEINTRFSSYKGSMPAHDDQDLDLIANVVHGELKVDICKNNNMMENGFHEDSGGTSSTQNHPLQYSVSPRELSLRLHELNQSILEDQIKELEAKLHHSQKQLQLMEAEKDTLNSCSDIGSSNRMSPIISEKEEDMSKPLCLNLACDSLDAYEETYEEFIRVAQIEQPPSPKTTSYDKDNSGGSFFSDDTSLWDLQDVSCQYLSLFDDRKATWKHTHNLGNDQFEQVDSLEVKKDRNIEKEDDDDEDGRILIEQIVQKMRKNSAIALNAQRMLFCDNQ